MVADSLGLTFISTDLVVVLDNFTGIDVPGVESSFLVTGWTGLAVTALAVNMGVMLVAHVAAVLLRLRVTMTCGMGETDADITEDMSALAIAIEAALAFADKVIGVLVFTAKGTAILDFVVVEGTGVLVFIDEGIAALVFTNEACDLLGFTLEGSTALVFTFEVTAVAVDDTAVLVEVPVALLFTPLA